MSQTTIVNSHAVGSMCIQSTSSSAGEDCYLTLRGHRSSSKPSHPGESLSQSAARPRQHCQQLHRRHLLHPRFRSECHGQPRHPKSCQCSKLTKPSTAIGTTPDEPQKTSPTKTLTKTRNWMAHVFPWQTVKALFESTLTKTGSLLARIFSQQNLENAVGLYDENCHGVGTACRTASRNIYKRATAPRDGTKATDVNAMRSSRNKGSTKSWFAKKAKTALRITAYAVRVLFATGKMGLDAAMGALEIAEAGALYAIDKLCEE